MSSKQAKYDIKLIVITTIILVIIAIAFYFYLDTTKLIIRGILENKFTKFFLWITTVIVFLVHYIKHKNKEISSERIITKKFGDFVDSVLGGIGYATFITTSLTLIKGLYIQSFFENSKVYFHDFQDLDLMAIFGVSLFILYFSIMKVVEIGKEVFKIEHTEQVLNEDKKAVVDDSKISDDQDNESSEKHPRIG